MFFRLINHKNMALQEEFEEQGNWLFKYRSYLPLVVLGIGLLLFVRTELHPEIFFLKNTPYEFYYNLVALLVSLLGLFIRIYTVGHSPKNTSGRNTTEGQVADQLNTTGIYSMVRHPLYLGNFLMWLGPAMLTEHLWFLLSFCLFYWIYYERIMFAEEQFLRRKFAQKYTKWSAGVPAFIPKFKNFIKPNLSFFWKKVLKKEKNGLLAIFLIFSVFDILGQYINHKSNYNYFLIGMCILTGLSYIVIRYLKNNTNLLEE